MRAAQEESSNKQEEIDAIRIQRSFEDSERQAKLREQLAVQKRERILKDLDAARKRQFADKENIMAQNAAHERDEFLDIIQNQKEMQDKEKRMEEMKKIAFKKHKEDLVKQMQINEEIKRQ